MPMHAKRSRIAQEPLSTPKPPAVATLSATLSDGRARWPGAATGWKGVIGGDSQRPPTASCLPIGPDFYAKCAKPGLPVDNPVEMGKAAPGKKVAQPAKNVPASGTAKGRRIPGTMNKLETRYSLELERRVTAGEVVWWKYEAVTLKLAPDVRYTCDFFVMLADGSLEAHETKGFYRDDSRIKLHTAASLFPWRFWLVKEVKGGGWDYSTPYAADR